MAQRKEHLAQLALFIREHRGNENNFDKLYDKIQEEISNRQSTNIDENSDSYGESLRQTMEKQGAVYKDNKEKGISNWQEFENFVSHFEKSVTEALNEK